MRWRSDKTAGRAKLAAATLLIVAAWLVVLPWLAASTGQHEQADRLEARGIDPTALFYSDHDLGGSD